MDNSNMDIPDNVRDIICYPPPHINTPLKRNIKVLFADYIASGRPSPYIEKYISSKILPYYSNTHSNAYCGTYMKNQIKRTKDYMRQIFNITKNYKIIFSGNGTTSATNHLIALLDISHLPSANIFLSIYEHHSNYIPWIELQKKNKNVTIHIIPIDADYNIDTKWLDEKLASLQKDCLNIVSITGCSNVTGILVDVANISAIVNKYNKTKCEWIYKTNVLFVDYACSAPYIPIDTTITDALFFSPHKFIGGVSTPGILIVNKNLFMNDSPYEPGGGCVKKVCSKGIIYQDDIEKKESAGTPNIVGIIKLRKVFRLKQIFIGTIQQKEHAIAKYVFDRFDALSVRYPVMQVLLGKMHVSNRLPIICICVKDMHYNLIVALLNDLFGIQTRGGVSCTGLFAELIERMYKIKGWCRISFHWLMTKLEIDYIIGAVEFIVKDGDKYRDLYEYDKRSNLYEYRGK